MGLDYGLVKSPSDIIWQN